jgi:hypothetical protein
MKYSIALKEQSLLKPIPREVQLQVDAAEGWLMLGNASVAAEELEKITSEFYYHPRILGVRWQIYAASRWWEAAWIVSTALCEIAPEYAPGWISQANALRHYKGLKAAKKLLLSVVRTFPDEPVVPYNLSCFSCQLGQLSESCKWLLRAFEVDKTVELKLMALCDSDLKPLWDKIAESAATSIAAKTHD